MTNPLRRLPAAVLVIVLALLPLEAWLAVGTDQLVLRNSLSGLRTITWTGSIAPDGLIAVRIEYDFGDELPRTLDIRVPAGARFLAVDGTPLRADIGLYASAAVQGRAVVTYEVPGHVTRYEDGAVVRFAALGGGSSLDGDEALFPCPRCYLEPLDDYGDVPLRGALYAPGAEDAEIHVSNVGAVRVESDPGVLRFVAIDQGGDAVALVATIDAAAVPELASSPGAAADVAAGIVDEIEASTDDELSTPSTDDGRRLLYASILTIAFAALVVWIARRLAAARRDRIASAPRGDGLDPSTPFRRPSELEPALAGLVVGGEGPGDRSVVAGTLLELAHRGVVSIDGIDSERFTLTVPPGAKGSTVFEEAVLAALRPQGQVNASATLTGPPLWGPDGNAVARRLARVLTKVALKHGLVRHTLSMLVLLPASVGMGVVALVGSDGLSGLGLFAVAAGPLLAITAAILSGMSLTRRGREERERWEAYADWLRSNTQLRRVGAPGVATWGEVLPHAAALGAAPVAARSLSPRRG